jgi:hypothetical protein
MGKISPACRTLKITPRPPLLEMSCPDQCSFPEYIPEKIGVDVCLFFLQLLAACGYLKKDTEIMFLVRLGSTFLMHDFFHCWPHVQFLHYHIYIVRFLQRYHVCTVLPYFLHVVLATDTVNPLAFFTVFR